MLEQQALVQDCNFKISVFLQLNTLNNKKLFLNRCGQ